MARRGEKEEQEEDEEEERGSGGRKIFRIVNARGAVSTSFH